MCLAFLTLTKTNLVSATEQPCNNLVIAFLYFVAVIRIFVSNLVHFFQIVFCFFVHSINSLGLVLDNN